MHWEAESCSVFVRVEKRFKRLNPQLIKLKQELKMITNQKGA